MLSVEFKQDYEITPDVGAGTSLIDGLARIDAASMDSFSKRYSTNIEQINLTMYSAIQKGAVQVRDFTINLLKSLGIPLFPNSYKQIEAIYEYVRYQIEYVSDPKRTELFMEPGRALQIKAGDCDDKTILAGAMLRAIGFEIMVVLLDIRNQGDYNHVYLFAVYNGSDAPGVEKISIPGLFIINKDYVPVIPFDTCYLPGGLGSQVPRYYRRKALYVY